MALYPNIHRWVQRTLLWQTILFPLLAFVLFLATTSQPYPVPASANDKLNHIAAFIGLGVLLHWSYPRLAWIRCLSLLIGYGLFIEVIQAFLPTREFSLLDLLADASGAAVGLVLGQLLRREVEARQRGR